MYKKHLVYAAILCGALFSNQLNTKTKCGTTKCCVTPSSPTFDCIQQFTDFIIVGLGTAGAVLARELSEPLDGVRCNVTVLEAGQNRSQDPIITNNNPFFVSQDLTANSKFAYSLGVKTGTDVRFDNNNYFISEGRMWGGSSAHNFMTAVRCSQDYWDDVSTTLNAPRWTYNNLLPIMKDVETYQIGAGGVFDPTQRGDSGLLKVTQASFDNVTGNNFNANIMTNITGVPLPLINDYNAEPQDPPNKGHIGVTTGQSFTTGGLFFPPSSQRTHSQNSFCPTPLDDAVNPVAIIGTDGRGLDGRKLQVVSNALVCRVIFDGNCAVGVEYILNGDTSQVFTLCARKEVILCAGTMNTPAILQRSGVGPQDVLGPPLNIDVVFANDNVGANLRNHYGSSCSMTADNGTATGATYWMDGAPYFNNGQASDLRRRIQCIANGTFSSQSPRAVLLAINPDFINDPDNNPANSFLFVNLVPKSTGTVVISSTDCTLAPTVTYNFWSDFTGDNFNGSDFDVAVSCFRIMNDAAADAGETMIYPTPAMFAGSNAGNNYLLLREAAQNGTFVFSHLASSCRMAQSAATGVCDPELRVFGTKNLRCADLSVVPIIPDGNTGFPCFYIAVVAAGLIRGEIQ